MKTRNSKRGYCAVCVGLFLFSSAIMYGSVHADKASPPWQRHGPLQVSENGHYLMHEDCTPFLWLGGTVWGMAEWLNREDVDLYLDNRKEKGVNVVQMCLIWGKRRDPGGSTLNDENAYGHRALLYTDGVPDPAKPDTVAGGSPTEPNDYWDHVAYILKAAEERGMYMAVLPVWGRRYVNAVHKGASTEIFTVENAKLFGEFLGRHFQSAPNVIWVMGGDVKPIQGNRGIDKRTVYRSMAEGIAKGVTGTSVLWNESSPAWDKVFMTYHPNGEPLKNSSDFFHTDPWLDFNMIETFVHRDEVYQSALRDYLLGDPVKPTVQGEPNYEGHTPGADAYAKPVHMRRQAYHSFFAGAAGFTYGAHEVEDIPGPLFSPSNEWKELLDLGGAQALPILRNFLKEQKWYEWVPDTHMVVENKGGGEEQIVGVTVPKRNKLLVYFPSNREATIKVPGNIIAETFNLTWFNTADGKKTEKEAHSATEIVSLKPPENVADAVAILEFRRDVPVGVVFRKDTLFRTEERGDNWCLAWSADGSQITSMCDGNWLNGQNRYHNHLYRIHGGPENFTRSDISGYPSLGQNTGRSWFGYGVISVKGILYSVISKTPKARWSGPFRGIKLLKSSDNGATWSRVNSEGDEQKFKPDHGAWNDVNAEEMFFLEEYGLPHQKQKAYPFSFVDFVKEGRDHSRSKDGFVYVYSPEGAYAHKLLLARAPADRLGERNQWEYFKAYRNGEPVWTGDIRERGYVHVFPEKSSKGHYFGWYSWLPCVVWNEGLGLYIMVNGGTYAGHKMTNSDKDYYSAWMHTETGSLGFWFSKHPYGPWTRFYYTEYWTIDDPENRTYQPKFSPKWISEDGREMVLIWSDAMKNAEGRSHTVNYTWNQMKITIE